jgi:hypothetical protein
VDGSLQVLLGFIITIKRYQRSRFQEGYGTAGWGVGVCDRGPVLGEHEHISLHICIKALYWNMEACRRNCHEHNLRISDDRIPKDADGQ